MKFAPLSDGRKSTAEWLLRGKALETQGTASALTEAVQAYDAALTLLHAEPLNGSDDFRHELAIVWMNRGRARSAAPAISPSASSRSPAFTCGGPDPGHGAE